MRRAATPAPSSSRLRGVRVLIVEDHEDSLQGLRQMVEHLGATAVLARTGEEALDRVRDDRPDVILLDLVLPGLDGFTVAHGLKTEPSTTGIPIVAVTALGDASAIRRTWEAGFAAHLTKPISIDDVATSLARVLGAGAPR